MNKNLYGMLVKFPEPGRVKSRLATEIGAEQAASTYACIVEQLLVATRPLEGQDYGRVVIYSPADKRTAFTHWCPHESLLPQRGDDIGRIMANALEDFFESGASRAVLTGSDIPRLDREVIQQAFRALDEVDVVLGPAVDGGYYLIGMKALHQEIFTNIAWGTKGVLAETVDAIRQAGLTFKTVATLEDLDTLEDFLRAHKKLEMP